MYRIQGIVNAFKIASTLTTGSRLIGQLAYVDNTGKAVLVKDDLGFPLTEKLDVDAGDLVAAVQVNGIAKVYVELVTSIVAGSSVSPGSTGIGVKLGAAGDSAIGYALETPTGNGSYIPVLLIKHNIPS